MSNDYSEWLMELLLRCGVGNPFLIPNFRDQPNVATARVASHLEWYSGQGKAGWVITPTAITYLETHRDSSL